MKSLRDRQGASNNLGEPQRPANRDNGDDPGSLAAFLKPGPETRFHLDGELLVFTPRWLVGGWLVEWRGVRRSVEDGGVVLLKAKERELWAAMLPPSADGRPPRRPGRLSDSSAGRRGDWSSEPRLIGILHVEQRRGAVAATSREEQEGHEGKMFRPALRRALKAARELERSATELQTIEEQRPRQRRRRYELSLIRALTQQAGQKAPAPEESSWDGKKIQHVRMWSQFARRGLETLNYANQGKRGRPPVESRELEERLKAHGMTDREMAEVLQALGLEGRAGDASDRIRKRRARRKGKGISSGGGRNQRPRA